MSFNSQLYRQTWQQLDRSNIITPTPGIVVPIPLHIYDRLPSTNTKLWELIDKGNKTPVGAIALEQTAGKGQWGRNWVSGSGGLYLSVALDINLEINKNPHLVMSTAWGIATVLRSRQLPVTIKWSNDLILEKRKLGGIKIETRVIKNKLVKAVVGVGVNWRNNVPEVGINLETYYQNKVNNKINYLEELAAIVAYGIVWGYQYYLTVGIEQLLSNYQNILSSIGQQVTLNNSIGKVIGVTTDGKLKVKMRSPGASTEIAFAPGQISLGYGLKE